MGLLETIFGIAAIVIAVLLGIIKIMWNIMQSKNNQIGGMQEANQEWQNYSNVQKENSGVDQQEAQKEQEIAGQNETDQIINTDKQSTNF
jgi:hypothetical protein